ncbi:MAG: glycosyltransferase family 9 protein [Alphaproteobacteria bacterium]
MKPATGRVLVIKHGALGDFVMALGPMRAIRAHHPDAHIVLLTGSPFADLAVASGVADEIWTDDRPRWWRLDQIWRLRRALAGGGFGMVYDLQTSGRTGWYYRLWPDPKPLWSGIAAGCSHPDDNPDRRRIHTIDRQREQLRRAGIADVPDPDLSWLTASLDGFGLPRRYAVLVPGGAAHRPAKRWPTSRYAALAQALATRDLTPVVVGGVGEGALAGEIRSACREAIDLTGRTEIVELAALFRGATLAVGNDTGPMHVAAIAGAPSLVLFSKESDPKRTAPRGRKVKVLRKAALNQLPLANVLAEVDALLA